METEMIENGIAPRRGRERLALFKDKVVKQMVTESALRWLHCMDGLVAPALPSLLRMVVMVICFASASAYCEEMKTVLAIGDSITEGGKSFTCYRQVLVPELEKRGVPLKFIGPKRDATCAHAGYGGKNTKYLLSITKKIYSQYPADIVLLHSGHNSFSNDKPVPGIIKDTENIIKTLRKINPGVTVLLAQVIPAGKLPKYSYIPELNRELAKLADKMKSEGYKIVLVNQEEGFEWKSDTVADKVHPNKSGATKMAEKWMAALLTISVPAKREGLNK